MYTLVSESISKNGQATDKTPATSTPLQSKHLGPDPQVIQKPTRRRFSAAEKVRILKLADACQKPGELGELLRREGIYSSSIASFRKQQAEGKFHQKSADQVVAQRKHKEADRQREARKLLAMQKEIQQLRGLLDLQKKLSDLLALHLPDNSSE
jgi:transposase